jgi:predicted O-methyltransferase YrrM
MQPIDLDRLKILSEGLEQEAYGGDHWDPPIETCGTYTGRIGVELETGLLLYALVRRRQPVVAVETGTFRGYSAGWIASALADNARGTLWTVDSLWHDDVEHAVRARDLWTRLRVESHVQPVHGDSRTWTPVERPIDFLFIDAAHEMEFVRAEFVHYWQYLQPSGALVVFHDPTSCPPVQEAIDAIWKDYLGLQALTFRNMRGLTVMEVTRR